MSSYHICMHIIIVNGCMFKCLYSLISCNKCLSENNATILQMSRFSETHGDGITLTHNRTVAERTHYDYNNLVLSENPLETGKPFTIRCLEFNYFVSH